MPYRLSFSISTASFPWFLRNVNSIAERFSFL